MNPSLEPAVIVVPTHVGRGLIAARAFCAEETIGRVDGPVIDDPNYESDYCIDMGGTLSLEPDPPFRYLNHSCDPNCELVTFEGEDPSLYLVALRDIAPGEAMTIDYEWPADATIPCSCQSAKCRGWVVASGQEAQVSQSADRRPCPEASPATVEAEPGEDG